MKLVVIPLRNTFCSRPQVEEVSNKSIREAGHMRTGFQKLTNLPIDENRVGRKITMDQPGIFMKEFQSFADLQQAFLDL